MKIDLLIVPAVDLLDRCVVRVEQGDEKRAKIYSNDPTVTVRSFAENGASLVHMVDLNAAIRKDFQTNRQTVEKIINDLGRSVGIQIAGGIREISAVKRLLEMGAKRVVLSSLAYSNLEAAIEILETFGLERIVLALDYDSSRKVRTSGWLKQEGETVESAIVRFSKLGFTQFITTATARDGMMRGPDLETLENIKKIKVSTPIRIIASGGITSMQDVNALTKIGMDEAIVGKAIYEGMIPLSILRTV